MRTSNVSDEAWATNLVNAAQEYSYQIVIYRHRLVRVLVVAEYQDYDRAYAHMIALAKTLPAEFSVRIARPHTTTYYDERAGSYME